jgi:predicted amidohydrolase
LNLGGREIDVAEQIRAACLQMSSTSEKALNIEKAEQLVARAAAGGAELVLLPETTPAIPMEQPRPLEHGRHPQ